MNKRIILITGSSRGIGLYLVKKYLDMGYTILGCSRSESDFSHKNYYHYIADVTNESSVKNMIGNIRKKFKKLDVVINNAGVASMNHFLLTPTETARRIMDINYIGTFTVCREAARLLRKSDTARIVNFGTVAVPLDLAGEAAYAASKSAVTKLSRILAKELAEFKITVNTIGPTPVKTDLIAGVPEEKLSELLEQQAIKRFGTKEDVGNVVDFFIDEKSDFITGQTIYLGGV